MVLVMASVTALILHDLRNWIYAFAGDEWAFYDVASGIAHGQSMDLLSQAGVLLSSRPRFGVSGAEHAHIRHH